MTSPTPQTLTAAIACGGTGGHLFPGLAVAEQLQRHGCSVILLVSPKEVDQEALRTFKPSNAQDRKLGGLQISTLPAVGLTRGRLGAFVRGFTQSYSLAHRLFSGSRPDYAIAMGGFTSAPPILAAKRLGARAFLHESNTVPGRANRWLSWVVNRAFVAFPEAGKRLHCANVDVSGTPVREEFGTKAASVCQAATGLDPARPVVLVMGGSQGASGINSLVCAALPECARTKPDWQWIHLTGQQDLARVQEAYRALGLRAVVQAFSSRMDLLMGAATVCVSRAGASSLAELAATRLPSILVPYPAAADDHQLHNARAFERLGAAQVLEQKSASPEKLVKLLCELTENCTVRESIQRSLASWHKPDAAARICATILQFTSAANRAGCPERGEGPANPNRSLSVA